MSRIAALAVLAVVAGLGLVFALQESDAEPAGEIGVVAAGAVDDTANDVGVADADAQTGNDVDTDVSTDSDVTESAAPATSEAPIEEAEAVVPAEPTIEVPPILGQEPSLENLDGWLQSDITTLDDLDGTVHVVQFWTFGCFNCKNTLDNMAALYERHADDNFEVVGVHAPEFEFEKDPEAILAAAQDLNVTWPIALDTSKTNFRSWQEGRRFWPRTFVIDQNGDIRFDRIGEGAYEKLNATVAYLLENPPAPA